MRWSVTIQPEGVFSSMSFDFQFAVWYDTHNKRSFVLNVIFLRSLLEMESTLFNPKCTQLGQETNGLNNSLFDINCSYMLLSIKTDFYHLHHCCAIGLIDFLVQLNEIKVIDATACFLVIEGIEAHICFLQFLRTIIEWGGGMLLCSHCHYHVGSEDCAVGAFNTLRLYLKYLTHVLFI